IPELTVADSSRVTLTLSFDPSLARMHRLTSAEQKEVDEADSGGVTITYPFELKLAPSGPYFVVRCTSGGSDDFPFAFIALGHTFDYKTNDLPGLRFEIPGDNCVYASGHNDTQFNLRRKFCLDGSRLREIKQPFHYVGVQSRTRRELTFYSDMAMATP